MVKHFGTLFVYLFITNVSIRLKRLKKYVERAKNILPDDVNLNYLIIRLNTKYIPYNLYLNFQS